MKDKYIIDNLPKEYILNEPLIVTVEHSSKDDFIACFYDVNIYGYGDTISEALDDLKELMIDQLEFLLKEKEQVILGLTPQKQLDVLCRHIRKRSVS